MSKRVTTVLLYALTLGALVALPAFASSAVPTFEPASAQAEECGISLAAIGIPESIAMAPCMVSVQCADGSSVSCNGNSSCSTSGMNGRCVTCDGVEEDCCAKTCCEDCFDQYQACLSSCGNPLPLCSFCEDAYDYCQNTTCGGCP